MYNNLMKTRRGRPWQTMLLAALLAWLLPQRAAATYVDETANYAVSLGGSNIVYLEAPVYDMDGADTWISDGRLKVTVDGTEYTVITWEATANVDNDKKELSTFFTTSVDGFFDITLGNTRTTARLTKSADRWLTLQRNTDGETFDFSAEWVVPYNFLGKKLTFTWDVERDGNSRSKEKVKGLNSVTINMPAAAAKLQPFVSTPMMSPTNPGKLELPWFMASDSIVSAYYEYKDASGKSKQVPINNMANGIIELEANVPHHDFRVVCSYKQAGDKGSYLIENQSSTTQNIAMIHAPTGLSARFLGDQKAKVEVTWSVPYMEEEDLVPTDFFEVQRSLTGREEDFETITQDYFTAKGQNKKSTYTFVDSTLVEAIEADMLTNGGTLANLTYRVRRAITQDWGWGASNNCAATTRCVLDGMHLLRIADYTAQWQDEKAYTVRVAWQYADEYGAVWDDRARMMLRVISKNRDGAIVDSLTYTLDQSDRALRYKTVNLTRSCVYYDVDMYVERGESPFNYVDQVTASFFPIRTASDWHEFAKMINTATNTKDINARLYADITISEHVGIDPGAYYRGTFDGNGHTVTFNKTSNDVEYMAPFRYVGNATIKNLHVAGNINTSKRYAAGLIGWTMEGATINIENCRSSVTLNSSVSGEGLLAGFIARQSGSNVVIRNSKFDGSFEGDKATHNRGYVAWVARGSSLVIENCVFAPDHINTSIANCNTWVGLDTQDVIYSIVNSYATREYSAYIIIRNANDWKTFVKMVEDCKNQYWVDATLDADISLSGKENIVGYSGNYPYRGTLDGNGHTINLNISDDAQNTALFSHVSTATFKNLRLTGTISSSKQYLASLIGRIHEGGIVTIENCRSSVTLKSSANGDATMGGFVGATLGNSNTTFRNCKFDGSFEGANSHSNGGYVGWANGSVTIENSLFAPDHISTKLDYCDTWKRGGGTLTITNSHATKYMPCEVRQIDGKWFMVLQSSDDWQRFVEVLQSNPATNAIMDADFKITTPADDFRGIFDGNGHTLDIDFSNATENMAIFKSATDYTIKNLRVTGRIWGGGHAATFVGVSSRTGAVASKILNCRSSVTVQCSSTSGYVLGGFVGRGRGVDIVNCLFDGDLWCNANDPWAGAFYGFVDGSLDGGVQNCLEYATWYYINHKGLNIKPWTEWGNGENQWTYNNWSYNGVAGANDVYSNMSAETVVSNLGSDNWEIAGGRVVPKMFKTTIPDNPWATTSASDMVATLGSGNWTVVDGQAVPVMQSNAVFTSENSFADKLGSGWTQESGVLVPETKTIDPTYATIVDPELKGLFYHKNTGTIDPVLMTTTRQSSVVLTWTTDGSPIDYFKVMRRVKDQGEDQWKEVATDLTDLSYEDTSVSPLLTYEYKVLAVNDCEGITSTETQVKVGECKHTGRVEGYVRFNDGTGAPGIMVSITYEGNEVTHVETDESGYFEVDELSYQGKTAVDYSVGPVARSGINIQPVLVTFNATSNNETLREFVIENGRRFSGYVMYDGTSIPVKGVNFLVDGNKIHNAKGDFVETDYDGSFSFRVLEGEHTIQAVMDNHRFTNDGWYKNSDKQDIKSDVAGIYFYDDTKVKLIGRIAGGDDQGLKPLGNNLSKNNLGDSLTMVLTLEGDNTSWLVYDNLNPNKSQRDEVVRHQRNGQKHYTTVTTQRKRMVVWPDVKTGEYELLLPPVRWKVQQVYCKGYPTLFQEGQVSEVIDLTNCLTEKDTVCTGSFKDIDTITVKSPKATYHAIYNRIYHSPVEVTYRQLGYDTFDYFGDKNYMATELSGTTTEVPLVYGVKKPNWPATRKDSIQAVYTLGHPVFSVERKYNILLQVAERYQYNNDPASGAPDLVPLGGGKARMQNGMKAFAVESLAEKPVEIDSLGRALFTLKADQTTTMLTGENALKTVTFTVEHDGTFIEAEPLQGYVLNMYPIGSAKTVLTEGQPLLFDILRDPPGAYSSNTLAKGATLNNTYMMNLTLMAGLNITYKSGEDLQVLSGQMIGTNAAGAITGTVVGPLSTGKIEEGTMDQLMYNAQGSKAFSHTMVLGHNVSTSGDPSMVGADADVYIGTVQNVVVTPMSTIRAVTNDMLKQMMARLGKDNIVALTDAKMESDISKRIDYGTVVVIASGLNANGDTIHLIRDVALGYGPEVQSQFFYSQKQILTQIIPDKAKEIADMMFCGTKAQAQEIADNTGRPVYLSLRLPTDSTFAVVNKPIPGHVYNDTIDTPQKGINYMVVRPANTKASDFNDEVIEKYQIIKAWLEMIAQNEGEKLTAHDLVANYDVAGTQGVNYSETFDNNYTTTWMNHFPIATEVDYFNSGSKSLNALTAGVTLGVTIAASIALSLQEMKTWSDPTFAVTQESGTNQSVSFSGHLLQWKVLPVIVCSTVGTDAETKAYNRTESFTIATDPASRLNVDVYRVNTTVNEKEEFVSAKEVFTNYNFNALNENMEYYMGDQLRAQDIVSPRSFVFRTRGGSTQNPWEDQRVTKVYDPGKVLDARTLKIVNPKIRLDKQSVSGVSVDDAAKFTVFVSNESEKPEATDGLTVLQVFAVDMLNPLGAKISINGQPLTTGGITVTVVPGTETALQMEVRAGQGFDYEKLALGVMSPTDPEHTYALTTFDVHFLREAGGVNIAVPGDKWVLNTMAQQDSKHGWFIPVTINGFDRHQHNFDHIEFQYKESQRGDDSWTNLCSFYASDSLMATANGVRKLIEPNGNITTEFYGEGWTMERAYDLRAVLFCRNGSDFLTTASKVVSGIKDTRRPQLFGTPEPKSGLLTSGDDIIFNFSEDIENNYLSAITNFEVKGEVNNANVSEMVSVQFNGTGSVESEAKRNFSGKDLTIDLMVKPDETGRDMPLFSHGTNGQKLQLWLTSDLKLKAVVNDQTLTASAEMPKNIFQQVAMVLNQTDSILTLYHGGVEVGRQKLTSLYYGTGPLIFGRTNEVDRTQSQYYEGRMMEARLWYNAMDGTLIGSTYGGHHLTGFEKDIVDYYPMNEGSGDYVIDYTQGANAKLMNAAWAIPQGVSLKVEKTDKGVLLDKNAINRTAEQDYTLMFWFKTDADGRGTLLSNGRGLKEDNGAENLFHIGFEPGIANPLEQVLMYRSNGFATEVPGDWSDGQWHHYAMTVNRGRGVANIYIDKTQVTTFETDSLGGISGGYPLIGATRYDVVKENGDVEVKDCDDALKGNVDELLFFAQALPQQLISTYATKSPNGDESGLLTYLSFDRQERQKDNSIELVPYAYSKKLYLDDQGKPRYQLDPETKKPTDILVRDYLFVDDEDVVVTHFDKTQAAPVVPYEEVTNLKFSFIGRGNQVLVELDEPNAKLNHRNIYVTLRDIEDLNGNTMASPQTACYYVTNSSLQWVVNRFDHTIKYGTGEDEDQKLTLPLFNNSATHHTYTIENCPRWLTLDKYTDVVAPQFMDAVTARVSKDLNIGTYNEIIYLTDEDGITEPLYFNLTIEGEKPDWADDVDRNLLQYSMGISGQVYLYDQLDTDSRDIVGVFDDQNVCHGFANISHDVQADDTGLFLTVYDNQTSGRELNFRLWQYSTGRELVLTTTSAITFKKDAMLGTDKPVRFDGGDAFVQNFNLNEGWNWVSFNLNSPQLKDVNNLLNTMPWNDNDVLTDMTSDTLLIYKGGQWLGSGSTEGMAISPKKSYAIKVQKACKFPIGGTVVKESYDRTIAVKQGWNAIGYTPITNLTVETALSDYYDYAETGDVIKSHTEFAYFTKAGKVGRWRGNLQYMKPGEGYMLLRKGASETSFTYPFYDPNSNFREEWSTSASRAMAPEVGEASKLCKKSLKTMSVSATVEGFELQDGDRLLAYSDGEMVGKAPLSSPEGDTIDPVCYLTIGGNEAPSGAVGGTIRFVIERDGEIVASTGNVMTFHANDVVGTPDEPVAIDFTGGATGIGLVDGDYEPGKWYTTSGIQLPERPTKKGVYILNGNKVVIK